MSICANITSGVEKQVVWNKALPTYREVDMAYTEFNNGSPEMVGKEYYSAVGVQLGVTNGLSNVL